MGQNSLHILERQLCNLASGGFLHHIYPILMFVFTVKSYVTKALAPITLSYLSFSTIAFYCVTQEPISNNVDIPPPPFARVSLNLSRLLCLAVDHSACSDVVSWGSENHVNQMARLTKENGLTDQELDVKEPQWTYAQFPARPQEIHNVAP